MTRITRELLRTWNACYSDDQIAALVPVEGLTPAEVAAKEGVPVHDRIWALARPEVAGLALWAWLADDVVSPALTLANVTDERCHAVVALLRRVAGGEVVSAWAEAASAAEAAWAEAASAAEASWAARASASWAARASASWAASWAAAWAASASAAWGWASDAGVSLDEMLAALVRRIEGGV